MEIVSSILLGIAIVSVLCGVASAVMIAGALQRHGASIAVNVTQIERRVVV